MSPTLLALTGFIAWTLLLLIVMEAIRTYLVLTGKMPSNSFQIDNGNLSPFNQRLARAHANCLEGLPIFGVLMLVAVVSGNAHLTDTLAWVLLAARIAQSSIHLYSVGETAVTLRFMAFFLQICIAVYWLGRLLMALVA